MPQQQDKFVALADRLIYDDLHTDYEQAHQKNWVIPWQTIHQFESEEAERHLRPTRRWKCARCWTPAIP